MRSDRTIKVIKKEHRRTSKKDVTSMSKTANQLRREMVQTVADWIAETRQELASQRRLVQQFRAATIESALTETTKGS